MPSGAKKRKAARKKKEKENNNINPLSTNNPQGNDDGLKSQDEKGSDGGEGNSPTYHEHGDQHHSFNDGSEEVEVRDSSETQQSASDVKSMEEAPIDVKIDEVAGGKEDSVVLVERGLQSEESSESKNVSIEQIEIAKESYFEDGNTGSTLNGESLTEKNLKDENYNSFGEANASHVLVESTDSSPAEETGNSAAESSADSAKAVASVSEVENGDTGSVIVEKSVIPPVEVSNVAMKINEDNVYPIPETTSNVEKLNPKEYASKAIDLLSSSSPLPKLTNGAEHIKDSEAPQCSGNQPHVASTPNMVQRTSWLSCCGLFEVLTSSNR